MACSGTSSAVGAGSPNPEQVSAPTCGCAPLPPTSAAMTGWGCDPGRLGDTGTVQEPCVPAGGRGASERCLLLPDRGTRVWICWECKLFAGAAAPASPGRREARTWDFYSEHLRRKSNSGSGAPGGPGCVWRLWVSCSSPRLTGLRTRPASDAPLTGKSPGWES